MNLNIQALQEIKQKTENAKGDLEYVLSFHARIHRAAHVYAQAGICVIPLAPNSRILPPRKTGLNYLTASSVPAVIDDWFHPETGKWLGYNLGLPTGGKSNIFVLDVDRHGDKDGFASLNEILSEKGDLPSTPIQQTAGKGRHYLFQWQYGLTSTVEKLGVGLDTRGGAIEKLGGHICAFPSIVDGNKEYRWENGGEIAKVPNWILTFFDKKRKRSRVKPALDTTPLPSYMKEESNRGNENVSKEEEVEKLAESQIDTMLEYIQVDDLDYEEWLRVGMSLHSQDTDSLAKWEDWSRKGSKFKEGECGKKWSGFQQTGGTQAGTLCFLASERGWKPKGTEKTGNVNIDAVTSLIERMNKRFSLVMVGGKAKILTHLRANERGHAGQPLYNLSDINSWSTLIANRKTLFTPKPEEGGKAKHILDSKLWLAHENRSTYSNGLGLYPSNDAPNGCFNSWQGFAVEPKEGDCSLFLSHVLNIICEGDVNLNNWVLDWLADMMQDAGNPKGCALVMKGEEGAGKGFLANLMGDLLASNYLHLTDEKHLTGNFNSHMANSVLLFADEITWGGNRQGSGKLKGLVTERNLLTERKGVDAVMGRSCIHVIVASNGEWVIPAGTNSRRWVVVNVSNKVTNNSTYFDALDYEVNNGGKEAILHFLLNRKITVNLRTAIVTEALIEQQALSQDIPSPASWWSSRVLAESFNTIDISGDETKDITNTWAKIVKKADFYEEYELWCIQRKERVVKYIVFCTSLKKLGVTGIKQRSGTPPTFSICSPVECTLLIRKQFPLLLG